MTSILSPQSCDKTFTTTTQRARHMGEMFTCAICDKSYTRKYRLQQHILGHDPVLKESMKIYECDICHAKFSQKHRLTRHIKSRHLGIKPSVACSKCKKTFTCNHNLREHEKTACPYLKQVVMLTAPVDQSETSVTSDDDMTEYSLQDDVRPMINETQDTTEIETQRANSVSTHSSAESSPTNDVTETDSPPHVTGTNHNTSYSQCQDEQDTISGSFGVESHEMKTEIKEEVVSLRSEVKEEIEEMTPSTDSSTPLLELVPFVQDIKNEIPEHFKERLNFYGARLYNTETLLSDQANLKKINCTLNMADSNDNLLIDSKSSDMQNSDEGGGCNSHENSLVSNERIICTKGVNEDNLVEPRLVTKDNIQEKDQTKARARTAPGEVYLTGHSDNIFCRCVDCLVKFKEAKFIRPDILRQECSLCHKLLKSLKGHNCRKTPSHICTVCNKAYTEKSTLADHIMIVHEGIRKTFTCTVCKKIIYTKSSLRRHLQNHSREKPQGQPQKCEYCDKMYKSRESYINHKRRFHSGGQYTCLDCSKTFKSKSSLTGHIQIVHLKFQMLQCDLCSVKLKTEEGMKKHKAIQHPDNQMKSFRTGVICELCGKHFKDKARLENHMNIHKGIKPYVCAACGKCFRSVSNLDQHSKTHSDARPYVCDLCGDGFRIRNHLRQHMAVHGLVNTSVKRKRKQQRKSIDSDSDSDWLG